MSLLQFLFSFQGRVRRRDFWLFFLVLGFIYGGMFWQMGHVLDVHRYDVHGMHRVDVDAFPLVRTPLFDIFALVAIWMKLAVIVKRWHDRDKSGWWILINLIPVIGWFWQLIECGFLDGTQGANRFGPSPKPATA